MNNPHQPLFNPMEIAKKFIDEISNHTLIDRIKRNQWIIQRDILDPLIPTSAHESLLNEINFASSDLAALAEILQKWLQEASDNTTNFSTFFRHVKYSLLYTYIANDFEKKGEYIKAWAFINHASLMTGEVTEMAKPYLKKIETKIISEQNKVNANKRTKNFQPIKEEAARLLKIMKPEGGWSSITSAATELEEPLKNLISRKRTPGLVGTNINNLLRTTWIPKDDIVHPAWLMTKRPNSEE